MDDRVTRVRELLRRAGELHHDVYAKLDGDDPDWPIWYAEWLATLSDLPEVLGAKPTRSELVYHLVRLGKEHAERASDEPWQDYYARELVAALGA